MTTEELLEVSMLGGPGLDGYAYNADVYCETCSEDLMRRLAPTVAPKIESTDDPEFQDSETWPQPIFFGESDTAQHCGDCGEYLYGPRGDPDDEDPEAKAERLVDEDLDRDCVSDDERSNGPSRLL